MQYRILSKLAVLLLSCVLTLAIPVAAHGGIFTKSVAKAAARKAAHRSAAKSIGRRASKKITARKAARRSAKKTAPKKDWKKIYARDLKRVRNSAPKPLQKDRTVRRYTSMKDAKAARKNGISTGTHMTAKVPKGRPVSANTAQQRYGLRKKPTARMTIQIPRGHAVKKNKVIGGKAGYGEITAARLPGKSIKRIERIH
jgi:hypothetical protein